MQINRSMVLVVIALLGALLVAACGDDGLQYPEKPDWVQDGPGIVIVDGRTYTVTATRLCGERGFAREFDFAATAGEYSIFPTIAQYQGGALHDLALLAPEGVGGNWASESEGTWTDQFGTELPGPPFEFENGQVRGSMTVVTGEQMADPIQVSFAIPIPEEESGPTECPPPQPAPR